MENTDKQVTNPFTDENIDRIFTNAYNSFWDCATFEIYNEEGATEEQLKAAFDKMRELLTDLDYGRRDNN